MTTVEEMYLIKDADPSTTSISPLFTRYVPELFNFHFWSETYGNNYNTLDERFRMKYKSFKYFNGIEKKPADAPDYPIEALNLILFRRDVVGILVANAKRYEELWRINTIDDNQYSLYDNYNTKEIMDRDTTADTGAQHNSSSDDYGSRTDSNTRSVAPYDSDVTHIESSNGMSKGAQHDSGTTDLGSRHDEGTENYTLTKVGNIGTTTVSDMITKHKRFWDNWKFIDMIFEDISRELLLVD